MSTSPLFSCKLHWLPITKRCQFKILTMTYKASHHNAPQYICDMLNWYQPARTLRSASTTSLVPNRNRTIRYGRRLLDTSSAALWNPLPDYIKSADTIITFKAYLKTYMFIILTIYYYVFFYLVLCTYTIMLLIRSHSVKSEFQI